MQKVLSYVRRAVDDYNMINDGEKITVGVSGGKDSVLLLASLVALRRFYPKNFSIVAVALDLRFNGQQTDFSELIDYCKQNNVEFIIKPTDIANIVFSQRKEKNPCSLCARMRRGALHDATIELGSGKIALGHHYNDAVETFLMNLFSEGRIGCFSPVTYLSRKNIYMIRPLIYIPESEIISAVKRLNLPVIESRCPADKHTLRQDVKEKLAEMENASPGVTEKVFGAIKRSNISGW